MAIGVMDRVMAIILPEYNHLGKGFDFKNDFKKHFHYTPKSSRCYIILSPIKRNTHENSIIKQDFIKLGFSYLSYNISKEILSVDYGDTKRAFNIIKKKILSDIKNLKRNYGFREFEIIGESMSCVSALMVANNTPLIKKSF